MTTTSNGHSRTATSALRRKRRGYARRGEEPIAALTPDLGPLPPIPVVLGDVLATDPTLVIARMVARGWMRYRTDGHRTPHSRCRSVDTVPVADTRQPDDPTSY